MRVPWTARSHQSVLKEISLEYSLEGLMMKLWLPDEKSRFIRKDPDVGERLTARGEGGNR